MAKTLVIGEPGCTAQGDKATMRRLIETAYVCGANVYKATWIRDLPEMMRRRNFVEGTEEYARFASIYGWHVWPLAWHAEFQAYCHELGMEYACTVHTPDAAELVAPFVDYLKISSFEATDGVLIKRANETRVRVIVSTGMMNNLEASVWCWKRLHCVSAYPAPLESMHLQLLTDLCHGLSDHSRHLLTGALAVALSAEVIEAHYRLDDCDPTNPDYAVAFSPAEFVQYIKNIRDAEIMLGSGEKKRQPCEEPMLKYRVKA